MNVVKKLRRYTREGKCNRWQSSCT